MKVFSVTFCLISLAAMSTDADMVFFEQNANLSPASTTYASGPFGVLEVGFAFTPATTIDLSGFRTNFFSTDGRTVSFQLFQSVLGVPITTVPLVNESFTALAGVLHGVDFDPFTLVGGTEYFAAVTNLSGLGVNFAAGDATEVPTGEIRVTFENDGSRFTTAVSEPPFTQQIFQFVTPAPVPEPSTTILLGLCGVVGGGLSWRRRRVKCAN